MGFSALVYKCRLNVDWDGAPKAYGLNRLDSTSHKFPLQKNLNPWEVPANNGSLADARADSDGHWVGVFSRTEGEARAILAAHYPNFAKLKPDAQNAIFHQFLDTRETLRDVNGRFPVVQLKELGGVEPGYYVSQCNARSGMIDDDWDQRSYIDASVIHYAALPNLPRVHLGDFGLIIRNTTGDSVGFFFGDTGAGNHLGECSGAVKLDLAPERNAEDEIFTFMVFPGSGGGQPNLSTSLLIAPAITSRLSKLRNTGNTLAEFLAPESPERQFTMRKILFDWGGPGPPSFPMKL